VACLDSIDPFDQLNVSDGLLINSVAK
jgi:hypothetical protein